MSQPRSFRHWLAIALAAGVIIVAAAPSWAMAIIKGPYLQKVTQTSIVVMWETDTAATGTVEYGPTTAYGWTATDPQTATIHEVQITGLSPDSLYHYRASSPGATSSDYTFQTAPPPGVPFRFAAYGDTRSQPSQHQAVINRIVASAPRLVLHSGDLVADGNNYSGWQTEFFGPAWPLMRNTPMATSLGNHENDSHWYYDFFSNPMDSGNEGWYTFRYGDARFIALNTCKTYSTGSAQYNWFLSTVSAPTDAIWTFVFFHHPPYASGGHTGDTGVQTYLVPLCEQYNVDIVFNGHCHNYERSVKSGVVYITTGGGGAPLADVDTYYNPYRVYAESLYHHCVIDIDGKDLTCWGVRKSDGSTFDQFTLSKVITATSPPLSVGWNLISLPLPPEDPDPATVFAGINIEGQLYRWVPEERRYAAYLSANPSDFGEAQAGVGYWLYLDTSQTISYVATGSSVDTISLPAAGWSMIGHPRTTATPMGAFSVRDEIGGTTLSLVAAWETGWIALPMYAYQPTGGYLTVGFEPWRNLSTMEPWQGRWIATNQDTLSLLAP